MGSPDEQHQELGTGNREESGNIRLEYYDRNHEDKSLPFFGGDDTIREILGTTPHLSASKEEIKDFYERNTDNATRTEYIKGIFNNDYTRLTLNDGRLVGYKTFQNVLHLWEGEYENRTAQSFYDWGVIAQHFEAMRLLGELTDTMKPIPSMDGQLTLIMGNQAEEQKTSAFTFSQEIIDAVLTRGSGVSEGKMRIYEQFEKSISAKENADFLKNEYGWGGSYPVIIGAGIDEQHDGKGITISKGIGSDKPHITLSWSQVEKRIGDLIRMDRYLNPKEKEKYPEWLEKQEERRAELAEQRKNREILSTAPPEPENKEDEPEAQYEYHLGDSVYIGASQYEILSFDENRVMLYDFDMPLFNKELSREEFDRKVRENPMNDHLKVSVLPAEEKTVTGENKAQNDTETVPDFSPKTGYDDAFFIDRDNESVTWMYYNPDSNAGGQYVTNTLSFDEIQQVAREYDSAEEFFDYLGSILGMTSFTEMGVQVFEDDDNEAFFFLDGKTVLVEKDLNFDSKLKGRKNFTLMHEGSHQIFKMLFPNDYGVTQKSAGVHYYKANSERNKPISDWEEWQANTLGAAILLPENLIKQGMYLFSLGEKIECLNKIYYPSVYKRFDALADFLGCSKKALAIRMKQLGLLKKEYLDNPFDLVTVYPEVSEL